MFHILLLFLVAVVGLVVVGILRSPDKPTTVLNEDGLPEGFTRDDGAADQGRRQRVP